MTNGLRDLARGPLVIQPCLRSDSINTVYRMDGSYSNRINILYVFKSSLKSDLVFRPLQL